MFVQNHESTILEDLDSKQPANPYLESDTPKNNQSKTVSTVDRPNLEMFSRRLLMWEIMSAMLTFLHAAGP